MSRAHDTSHIPANLMFHSTLKQHRRQLAGTCSSNQQATDRCCAWNRSHCHWHISHARQWGKVTQPDTKRKLCMTCPSFQWVTCHFWPNFSSEASNAMWQDLHVISGVLKVCLCTHKHTKYNKKNTTMQQENRISARVLLEPLIRIFNFLIS